MKFLSRMLAMASILSAFGASTAYAQGSVSGVNVTTSVNTLNITVTAPNTTQATFGAGATTGVPLPDKEWSVTAGPFYSWSASPGIAKPSDTSETTVSAPFTEPGRGVVSASCTVSYTVVKDDGTPGAIYGSGTASVTVFIGVVWDPGLLIGDYFGKDAQNHSIILHDGRLLSPQDQSQTPYDPVKVYAFPGAVLECVIEKATSLAHKSWPADDDSHLDYEPNPVLEPLRNYFWSCDGGHFPGLNQYGNPATSGSAHNIKWFAPYDQKLCIIGCAITDSPPAVVLPDTGTRGPKSRVPSCNVIIVSANISVRRTGAVKPDPNHPGQTMPADFSNTATIAAGGLNSDEHKADVRIAVLLPDGSAAPAGIQIAGLPTITGYKGVSKDATISISHDYTDAQGCIYGTYTSSDEVRTNILTLQGETAQITQVWNQLPDTTAWAYPVSLNYNTPGPISYRMQFSDNGMIPVTGHSLYFYTDSATVDIWDPNAGPYGGYVTTAYTSADIWDNSGYAGDITYSSPPICDSTGKYTTNVTVHLDDNAIVDQFTFYLRDEKTYDSSGAL